MTSIRNAVGVLAAVAVLTACNPFHDPGPTVHQIARDDAWRTVNANLAILVPDWDAAAPFPESPLSPPAVMRGCSQRKDGLASGPPWSLRVGTTLESPTPQAIAAVDRGRKTMEERGYRGEAVNPQAPPGFRRFENDRGYFVGIFAHQDVDGAQTYELISVSPCIRFPGDDDYA